MREYIINDKQLKTAIEAYLERELSRPITGVFVCGDKLPEIVRCKYCKHYDRMNDDEGWCMVPDDDGDYARWMVDDVGYCYLGERSGE